ncbi:hypothetical protein MRX96_019664 [Rhipicephalus microplus]
MGAKSGQGPAHDNVRKEAADYKSSPPGPQYMASRDVGVRRRGPSLRKGRARGTDLHSGAWSSVALRKRRRPCLGVYRQRLATHSVRKGSPPQAMKERRF